MIAEPLGLQHQEELETCIQALQSPFSEYSFANLYLFRHQHDYALMRTREGLFIRGKTYDSKRFLMPLFDLRTLAPSALKSHLQTVDFFYPIPEEYLPMTPLQATFSESDSDYMYHLEQIRTYPGRHLQGQRNHVHQFEAHYQSESQLITSELKPALHQVLEDWGRGDDYAACYEAIELLEQLKLFGRVYFVEKRPVGFLIGERQSTTNCVLHFMKGDTSVKGIYPYMYQDFAKHLENDVEWLNWEQDLGDRGLKQAKASYHPERLLKKMRLSY